MHQPAMTTVDVSANRPASTPRVWLVTGYRAGERGQILALADALGWPYELKQLSYRKREFRTSLFRGSDLCGIRLDNSSALKPPWPDLVISAGMRNEPVGRWIRAQNGGNTRLVHVGRPWARPEHFDLLVTTPQYHLPRYKNILHNTMTLHGITAVKLAAAADHCRARYAHLPEPYIGVILGGNSGPYTLGRHTLASIARHASELAQAQGGSLLITGSARTPQRHLGHFERYLSAPYDLYSWRPDDSANPYYSILGLSSSLVVTADSISMLSEACATGKPVYMAELGGFGYPMREHSDAPVDFRLSALGYSVLMRFGPRRLSRDLRLVHRALIDAGRVVWLRESFAEPPPAAPPTDLEQAVQRVRALFE